MNSIRLHLSFLLVVVIFSTAHGFVVPTVGRQSRLSAVVATTLDRTSAVDRAQEVAAVVTEHVLKPVVGSVATRGLATDWDAFWSRTADDKNNDNNTTVADRVATAMELLGPTYVKFGQALSARPDLVPPSLAAALSRLQDDMTPFDNFVARNVIRQELETTSMMTLHDLNVLMQTLSATPVAAASIGQVYRAEIPGLGPVALKVQRPRIRQVVEQDARLWRRVAEWVESIPGFGRFGKKGNDGDSSLIAARVVDGVDEFMSRILEELDYRHEAQNMEKFARLYSHRHGTSADVRVVVPTVHLEYCTDRLLVMEWIDGSKLSNVAHDGDDEEELAENLALIESGMAATLSQLLGTGVMHADPHAGNLIKVNTEDEGVLLGLLDYGMLSTVPESVRDALVCATAQVIFARDSEAVARLFGELQLLPASVLSDETERAALAAALERVFAEVLVYPEASSSSSDITTTVPLLQFDKLLGGLSLLVSRFAFQLPPYFLNIARALATLEGLARQLDPSFNALGAIYPYALERILHNPSDSPVVRDTLLDLMRNSRGQFDGVKIRHLIRDAAVLGGSSRRKVVMDVLRSKFGRSVARQVLKEMAFARGVKRLPRRKLRRRGNLIFAL